MQAWHLQHHECVSLLFESSGFMPACSCRKCPFFSHGLTAETDTGPCTGLTELLAVMVQAQLCEKLLYSTRAKTWNKLWNNNLSVTIRQLAFCTCSWKLVPHPLEVLGSWSPLACPELSSWPVKSLIQISTSMQRAVSGSLIVLCSFKGQ